MRRPESPAARSATRKSPDSNTSNTRAPRKAAACLPLAKAPAPMTAVGSGQLSVSSSERPAEQVTDQEASWMTESYSFTDTLPLLKEAAQYFVGMAPIACSYEPGTNRQPCQ